MNTNILKQLEKAKIGSRDLALLPHSKRNQILKNLAKNLRSNKKIIISANAKDLKNMDKVDKNNPMRDRLLLNDQRIENMAKEIDGITKLKDPIGEVFDCRVNLGLKICRKRVPFGVIGIIYESRPNVTTDVVAICIKSGNACVLKGGKEARESYIVLHKLINKSFTEAGANPLAVQFIDPKNRESVMDIINAHNFVDVIIPRGSSRLIDFVRENATVPVIETGAGVCHTFVDESAKLNLGSEVVFNAKTQRPSVCNSLDTLLVHKKISNAFLPKAAKLLASKQVEIFADTTSLKILKEIYPKHLLKKATDESFGCEFLSQKMSVKVVANIDEAIAHISKYSSKHSEAILSENKKNKEKFLNEIDAAAVYSNASTRFSDGAIFKLGSEIGVSTSKLHARGPMGPQEMTTYKWVVNGKYQTRK